MEGASNGRGCSVRLGQPAPRVSKPGGQRVGERVGDAFYPTWRAGSTLWRLAQNKAYYGGVFTQRGHSANYYGDYPGNNPENHPPAESCTINSKLKNSNI